MQQGGPRESRARSSAMDDDRPRQRASDILKRNGLVFFYAVIFGMAAYGVIKLLIWAADRLGLPF